MATRNKQIIDAKNMALGRLASQAAVFLMGKHKASFERRVDNGDWVEVVNYSQVKFTGNKMRDKLYYNETKRPGGLKFESLQSLWARRPNEVLRKAIWNMLPKNTLRKQMIKRLKIAREEVK